MGAPIQNRAIKGFELVKRVYSELYRQFGEDYSAEELLRAAQVLIDVTREEYVSEGYEDIQSHSGYFSRTTDTMIQNNAWLVFNTEHKMYSIEIEWECN